MIRGYFNYIYLIGFMPCLTGCYPCRFLDWNCNSDISETSWIKKTENCTSVQRKIAEHKLAKNYNIDVLGDIYSKCIENPNYKFESDPKYSNY